MTAWRGCDTLIKPGRGPVPERTSNPANRNWTDAGSSPAGASTKPFVQEVVTIKRDLISLDELREHVLKEPTLFEKIRFFFEDLFYSVCNVIAAILVRLGFFVGYRGAWNSVITDVKHPQVWELESHVTEYMLPRLKEFIKEYAANYIDYPMSYNGDRERWLRELEAVKYFLEVLHNSDIADSANFDEEKYYLGRLVFGEVYETLWY